jgi:NAD-dependent dihydropyrimidine dehydrogenase PreA subunit
MDKYRYLRDVATLRLDENKCNGCGMCITVCPHAVFVLENHKTRMVDHDACMECGACARNCPTEALSVNVGVGCATAIILGAFRGTEPDCGCSGKSTCCG